MERLRYNDAGEEVASAMNYINIVSEEKYFAFTEYINETEKSVTIHPYLKLYNKQSPYGIDVSSQYNMDVEYFYGGRVSYVKNDDGTYTFSQIQDKDEEICLKWWPKNQTKNDVVASDMIIFEGNNINEDREPVVTKSENLTILDSNKLAFNIYYDVLYGYACSVRQIFTDDGSENLIPIDYLYDFELGKRRTRAMVNIDSGNMSRPFKLQLIDMDGKVLDEYTTSVESYINKILDSSDSSYAKYKPMLKALLNYGAASQNYFGIRTDSLANRNLSSTDKVVNSIPQDVINQYNHVRKLDYEGLKYVGSSLTLKNSIALRHYFKLDEGRDISNYYFSSSINNNLKPVKKDDLYYIELVGKDISIFDTISLNVNGSTNYARLKYSPINYFAKVYNSNSVDPKLKSLVDSIYWFEYQRKELL